MWLGMGLYNETAGHPCKSEMETIDELLRFEFEENLKENKNI